MASKFLLLTVFVLDLIAFSLAVAAEHRRSSVSVATEANTKYCAYDSDIATGLGVGSFLFLMVSQLMIMGASKCLCCGRALRPGCSRVWAIVLFIFCWYTSDLLFNSFNLLQVFIKSILLHIRLAFFIAELCLLAGSVRNAYHTKYRTYWSSNPPSCETLRKGVFGAGAAFIVFTGILSQLFYVTYSKTDDGSLPLRQDTGIRMG
ncbi:uncharacterized protein LOC131013386 isoform X1 [Salvia miltiorrhiza]|uniref:uncharacterized protein LOC131013386 isoform X1 n=1 Tax=Salvia miltiorrhiza TaxID=226208 RepID=UPI0025AC3B09|nr:uncharacterized protein LOC131013386 isoform X1 [Salvia miltiorrhiza]XP_057797436.1 uncharacterized protein LOC131013386 isoform X1 [Salvia miltiorrhiza]